MEPTLAALPEKPRRFWDRENDWLFAGVVARTLDYFSTLNMRRRGCQEIFLRNDVVAHFTLTPPQAFERLDR